MLTPRFSRATFAAAPKSLRDMEIVAERILARIYPENLVEPTKLDVVEFMDRIEDGLGVIFGVEDLDPGEEGYLNPITREIVAATRVYAGALRGDGRARFTCCHEVGHIQHIDQVRDIIREGGPQLFRRINVEVPTYRDPEWQASAVGGALLMPRRTLKQIYDRGGLDLVVSFFGVSWQAADVRLRQVGLTH